MNEAQAHRGPDGHGVFEDLGSQVMLAHARLAILDLSAAAAQPMHSPDGRYTIVFNGEIYNFAELREKLVLIGHSFKSTGDTEVILHGVMEEGYGFLARLNGIFAIGIWDQLKGELHLARDPMGVKPLYYAEPEPGLLLFASEIKALFAYPGLRREPDFEVLQQHLAFCHASGNRTAFKAVRRLQPGCWLRWQRETRTLKIAPFHKLFFGSGDRGTFETATSELSHLVQSAVERQLVSDVPVGVFLSGGLDSSLITTIASKTLNGKLDCYTITYPAAQNQLDRAEEDVPYARQLARQLGVSLHEIELSAKVAEIWPKLICHLDEPLADPAAIACYLICQLARSRGTKVLLSGQGGDELFCGYPRYWVMQRSQWLRGLPDFVRSGMAKGAGLLPGARAGRLGALSRRVRRGLEGLNGTPERQFLGYCSNTPEHEIRKVLGPAFREAVGGISFADACLRHMDDVGLKGPKKFQERDMTVYLPNHNLLYTDKMGMAVGLEARVPLLDLELVARATQYPYEWLVSGGKTKALLRAASRGLVSDVIIDRPKAGFGAPYRAWLRYDLAEMWDDLMCEDAVRRRGWFDFRALQDARARSQSSKDDLYMLQWVVLTIELWAREFIDRSPVSQ